MQFNTHTYTHTYTRTHIYQAFSRFMSCVARTYAARWVEVVFAIPYMPHGISVCIYVPPCQWNRTEPRASPTISVRVAAAATVPLKYVDSSLDYASNSHAYVCVCANGWSGYFPMCGMSYTRGSNRAWAPHTMSLLFRRTVYKIHTHTHMIHTHMHACPPHMPFFFFGRCSARSRIFVCYFIHTRRIMVEVAAYVYVFDVFGLRYFLAGGEILLVRVARQRRV